MFALVKISPKWKLGKLLQVALSARYGCLWQPHCDFGMKVAGVQIMIIEGTMEKSSWHQLYAYVGQIMRMQCQIDVG